MAKYNLLVVASDSCGCGKFRSLDPHKMLAESNPDLFHVDFGLSKEILTLHEHYPEFLKKFDLICLHKQVDVPSANFIQICKFMGKKVILDVDDHYVIPKEHPMYEAAVREDWASWVVKHLRYADLVTTTTENLKKILLKHNPKVEIIPNAIDPLEPQFNFEEIESNRLRVGLVCGSSHYHDIKMLEGMYSLFTQEELDKLQFVICGFDVRGYKHKFNEDGTKTVTPIDPRTSIWIKFEEILTNNYQNVSPKHREFLLNNFELGSQYENDFDEPYRRFWTKDPSEYGYHYQNIDVLLAPLIPTEFNSVKSQLKAIEAGFLHKGLIASDFGPYTIDLKNAVDKNGNIDPTGNALLVGTNKNYKEWVKYIRLLLNNRELLETIKNNLYETVKDKYSLQNVTEKRKEIYLNLLENTPLRF